jgi:hypothetical protein
MVIPPTFDLIIILCSMLLLAPGQVRFWPLAALGAVMQSAAGNDPYN